MHCKKFAAILILFLLAAGGISLKAQPKYPFDFDSDWEWIHLMYGGYNITPGSFAILDNLYYELNISDARTIFRSLIRLEALDSLKNIKYIAEGDSPFMKNIWVSRLDSAFRDIRVNNDLDGLITAANAVWQLKKVYSADMISAKSFTGKTVDAKIYDTISVKLKSDFRYTEAYDILERLKNFRPFDTSSNSIIASRSGMSPDSINYFVQKAADTSALNMLYKIINPMSYKGLGGVSLYTDSLKKILDVISENETYFKFEIKNKLFVFLPRSVYTKINVNFLLGFTDKSPFTVSSEMVRSESDDIGVPLEFFGDDYAQLLKYITRKLFLSSREQIYYNLLPYILSGKDTTFGTVVSAIQEGGMLNYIAPLQLENRPISLLEKDFFHFRRTVGEIRKGTNKTLIDTLVQIGMSGNGLFYTMGTQMTYSIEKVIGIQAVKNSIIFGPVYFFRNYIEAYKEDPTNIRDVFRFSEKLEDTLGAVENKIPENLILDGVKLITTKNLYINEPDRWKDSLLANISNLEIKYRNSSSKYLLYIVLGEMLYREKFYSESYVYFNRAIPDIKDKIRVIRMLYGKFYKKEAFTEAALFSDLFIKYEPLSPEGYIYAGMSYYKTGDLTAASENFTTAKDLSAGNPVYSGFLQSAEQYLTQISNNEK